MGAATQIKEILKKEGITQQEFAKLVLSPEQYEKNGPTQMRILLSRDTLRYSTVEAWLDALGYEIVFKKKKRRKS